MSRIETLRLDVDGIWFGGDYNPEQWDTATRAEDIELMHRARVDTATVGVFAWSSIEPRPGEYRFAWLDEAMDRLHAAGVRVILATPTASPPPWFSRLHPEALPVTADGVRLLHGSRDTYNPAAPAYRAAAERITRVLAERYGHHPALALWHVHNEYGTVSHGPETDRAFRRWLRERYGDLDTVNSTWNTAFWSQGYGEWDDIHAPQRTQYLPNPSHLLDFRRFSADILLNCFRDQARILREITPSVPLTTNFILPTWNNYDGWAFAAEVDVVSIDHYPSDIGPRGEAQVAFGADLARSYAGGRPWLLMEQATSLTYDYAAGRFVPKEPGRMRRNTHQYLARGSFGSLFFQWRAPRVGAEFFHSAMVPHVGADSRGFREISALGAELAGLAELALAPHAGRVVDARIAIVWSADAWWASETRALPSDDTGFLAAVTAVHEALWRSGHAVDLISPDGDLARYDVVLVPSLIPVSDAQADRFARFARAGGHLVLWYLAGTTDEHLRVRTGSFAAAFAGLAGIRVEEHVPMHAGRTITLDDGSRGEAWSEVLQAVDAEVVAAYTADAHAVLSAGSPAITRRRVDDGVVHYISTRLDDASLRDHLGRILREAGVAPTAAVAGDGLEIVRRRAGTHTYLWILNHTDEERVVPTRGVDLLTAVEVDGEIAVAAGGLCIIREHRTESDIEPAADDGR
ncbi:beta-galactosidase [Microbacterium oleivorans]|uniref:Beta-galactosidase n=1 Tax=Microbacterium oleivorans TaxID=273677 RepID=A0A7D5F4J0_9MICO|nr:beta-galactosidase [Microbacterium oleivorans]QLD11287.1 beta-galactosidase [Microbacterium oleivorans]